MRFLNMLPQLLGVSFLAMGIGLLLMGLGRQFTARIQRRVGPPFYQAYLDVLKCLSKTSITHGFVMDLGTIMSLAGLIATAYYVPFVQWTPTGSGSLVIILYLMTIGYLGMAMGVSASGNPQAPLGIARALALMFGYKIPLVMVILAMILVTGSSDLLAIVDAQQGGPSNWFLLKFPVGFLAVEIAFQAMIGERPYDMMIAPAEIASGPMVELSGKYLGLAFLLHSVQLYVETALIVNLFLGGAANPATFFGKQVLVYLTSMAVNAVMARYRIEQGIAHLWKWAGSLAFIQLLTTKGGF